MFHLLGYEAISRLILSAGDCQPESILEEVIEVTGAQTVSFRLASTDTPGELPTTESGLHLLPIFTGRGDSDVWVDFANKLRDQRGVTGIGLEIEGEPGPLLDLVQTLSNQDFSLMVQTSSDPKISRQMIAAGAAAIMTPDLRFAIGPDAILADLLADQPDFPVVYQADHVSPSVLVRVMEAGFAAVELNGVLSQAVDPVGLAEILASSIDTGRVAYERGWTHPAPGWYHDLPPWHV